MESLITVFLGGKFEILWLFCTFNVFNGNLNFISELGMTKLNPFISIELFVSDIFDQLVEFRFDGIDSTIGFIKFRIKAWLWFRYLLVCTWHLFPNNEGIKLFDFFSVGLREYTRSKQMWTILDLLIIKFFVQAINPKDLTVKSQQLPQLQRFEAGYLYNQGIEGIPRALKHIKQLLELLKLYEADIFEVDRLLFVLDAVGEDLRQ